MFGSYLQQTTSADDIFRSVLLVVLGLDHFFEGDSEN